MNALPSDNHRRPERDLQDIREVARITTGCIVLFLVSAGSWIAFTTLASLGSVHAPVLRAIGVLSFLAAGLMAAFTVPFFFHWVNGAAHNAEVISGARLPIAPRWQVGLYFIPGVNMIAPLFGMAQIIERSALPRPGRALILAASWWLFFLLPVVSTAAVTVPPSAALFPYAFYDLTAATPTVFPVSLLSLCLLIRIVTTGQLRHAACANATTSPNPQPDHQPPG